MKLYTSPLNTAALQVRIALHYKGMAYEEEQVMLDHRTGDPVQRQFLQLNPEGKVPILVDGQRVLRQSLAIMEYLDESYHSMPALLPGNNRDRNRIRALSQLIACDIAPLTCTRNLRHMENELGLEDERISAWRNHCLHRGMAALEALMEDNPASHVYSHADIPSMADVCLTAQFYPLEQIHAAEERYPTISRIYHTCLELPAFSEAIARHGFA
jgi:maleylacetoacetate isomerase